MNSRERTKIALNHIQPDRTPMLMWITPEISRGLRSYFNVDTDEEVYDAMDVDVRWIHPDYIGPKRGVFGDGSTENEFGIRTKRVVNEFGSYDEFVFHPLATARTVEDVEDFPWPNPNWWDYDGMKEKIAFANRVQPRWLAVGYGQLFERGWSLMGFEKMLYELAVNPEMVEAVFDKLLKYYLAQTTKMLDAADGMIDMIYTSDDLASQESLLISPAMFRKYLKDRWTEFNSTLKKRFGSHTKIHFHSCGAVADLVPDLIDTGIDILNPIQPGAKGMDPEVLKRKYGDKLSFSGGFDIQNVLPHGTPEEVRAEAVLLARILGKDGGYIASAAHAVQADTPVENVLAMVDGFKSVS